MDTDDADKLRFITDENEEIFIDGFVMEPSANMVMTGLGFDESEDQTVARHLLKARRVWEGTREPHLVLPPVPSRNGGLPLYVITAWLRSGRQKIVIVVFVDLHRDKSIEEIFQMYCLQINFRVLAEIDHTEKRKMFDWTI